MIATDIAGCREIVSDPENGFLILPRNAQDLADKMLKLSALAPEKKIRMGNRSREIAEEKFSEKIVIDKYINCLRRN